MENHIFICLIEKSVGQKPRNMHIRYLIQFDLLLYACLKGYNLKISNCAVKLYPSPRNKPQSGCTTLNNVQLINMYGWITLSFIGRHTTQHTPLMLSYGVIVTIRFHYTLNMCSVVSITYLGIEFIKFWLCSGFLSSLAISSFSMLQFAPIRKYVSVWKMFTDAR